MPVSTTSDTRFRRSQVNTSNDVSATTVRVFYSPKTSLCRLGDRGVVQCELQHLLFLLQILSGKC